MIIIKFLQTNLTVHWAGTATRIIPQSCLGWRLDCHIVLRLGLRPGTGAGDDLSCRPRNIGQTLWPGGVLYFIFSPGVALDVLFAGAVSVIVLGSLVTELPELLPVLGTTWAAQSVYSQYYQIVKIKMVRPPCLLTTPDPTPDSQDTQIYWLELQTICQLLSLSEL